MSKEQDGNVIKRKEKMKAAFKSSYIQVIIDEAKHGSVWKSSENLFFSLQI